jgi:hypothetical protein
MLIETRRSQLRTNNMRPNGLIGNPTAQKDWPMTNATGRNSRTRSWVLGAASILASTAVASGQSLNPLGYSVATPRPINPAEDTTTPSAQAAQRQNPYLGSVPSKNTGTTIELSLRRAIDRGLRYNLGLIESNQASADVHAERLRALSALLPQLSADARQGYENLSYKEIGLKLPPIPGLPALPSTSGAFGYQDARVSLSQSLYNAELRNQYRARKSDEQASTLSIQDSRDVVVFCSRDRLFAGDLERGPRGDCQGAAGICRRTRSTNGQSRQE